MNFPCRCTAPLVLARVVLVGVVLAGAPVFAFAAEPGEVGERIDAARAAMAELDSLAESCHQELQDAAGDNCNQFREALDGEMLANYLRDCTAAKAWRDEFVAANGDSGGDADIASLQLLLSVEFACGQDAFTQRTDFVAAAYNALYRPAETGLLRGSQQSLRQLEFELDYERERLRLRQSLRQLTEQQLRETQRQVDRLQQDLLREELTP
ncbi:MAG: hypothetical protein WDZ76_03365 [Pseudohongiellaceae bacterium]